MDVACNKIETLYDSNEASQDYVEGILIDEWKGWLGTDGSVCLRHKQVSATVI